MNIKILLHILSRFFLSKHHATNYVLYFARVTNFSGFLLARCFCASLLTNGSRCLFLDYGITGIDVASNIPRKDLCIVPKRSGGMESLILVTPIRTVYA